MLCSENTFDLGVKSLPKVRNEKDDEEHNDEAYVYEKYADVEQENENVNEQETDVEKFQEKFDETYEEYVPRSGL